MKTKIKIFLTIFFWLFFYWINQTNAFDTINDTNIINQITRSKDWLTIWSHRWQAWSYDWSTWWNIYLDVNDGSWTLISLNWWCVVSWMQLNYGYDISNTCHYSYEFVDSYSYNLDLPSNITLFHFWWNYILINRNTRQTLQVNNIISLKWNYIILNQDNQAKAYNIDFDNMSLWNSLYSWNFDTNCPVYTPWLQFWTIDTIKTSYFVKQVWTDVYFFDKYYSYCKKIVENANWYFTPFWKAFYLEQYSSFWFLYHSYNTDQNYFYWYKNIVYNSSWYITDIHFWINEDSSNNPLVYFTWSLSYPYNFQNPVFTFADTSVWKVYKWDLNCKTPWFTSCKTQQDWQYRCSSDSWEQSPNNEKCWNIVVTKDENGSNQVASWCVVKNTTTYGTWIDEWFYWKKDNYDVYQVFSNWLFTDTLEALNYVNKTTNVTDFYLNSIAWINNLSFTDNTLSWSFLFNQNANINIDTSFLSWNTPTIHIYNRNDFNSFKIITYECWQDLTYKFSENWDSISFKSCDEIKLKNLINDLYIEFPIKDYVLKNILFKKYDITYKNDVLCHIWNQYTKNWTPVVPDEEMLNDLWELQNSDSYISTKIQKELLDKVWLQQYLDFYNINVPTTPYLQIQVPTLTINSNAQIWFQVINTDLKPISDKLWKSNISRDENGSNFIIFFIAVFYIIFKVLLISSIFFIYYLYDKYLSKLASLLLWNDNITNTSWNLVTLILYVAFLILKISMFWLIFVYILDIKSIFDFIGSLWLAFSSYLAFTFWNYLFFANVVNIFFAWFIVAFFVYIIYILANKYWKLN